MLTKILIFKLNYLNGVNDPLYTYNETYDITARQYGIKMIRM